MYALLTLVFDYVASSFFATVFATDFKKTVVPKLLQDFIIKFKKIYF